MPNCYSALLIILAMLLSPVRGQERAWKIAGDKITTSWAAQLKVGAPLPEYPRPQMVRERWQNLNGLWEWRLSPRQETTIPASYQGSILVPFAVESALSGVGRRVGKDSVLWYRTRVSIPAAFRKQKLLLHFGAVDWQAQVFVNGKAAGTHEGGYDSFSFDITPHLKQGDTQELVVRVWDPIDEGPQPRGKQVKQPHAIWYTPVTGIWQTVWLEPVPATYISATRQTPDIDKQTLAVKVEAQNLQPGDRLRVIALDGKQRLATAEGAATAEALLQLKNPRLWSPQDPHLYQLQVSIVRGSKVIDEVKSYFGMRKISMQTDAQGVQRMLLNNKFLFQFGPLDQGWWPDGLYTAPTEAALLYDIEKTKEMGFNMIRKHVKVEPARWYYHADRLGMLVWQDMPNGDWGGRWGSQVGLLGVGEDMNRSPESEKIYRTEWAAIMDELHNFTSIVVWVPFNEAWGQFKTEEITRWTMERDPSRLVNSASGGNFHPVGHILDIHHYPDPAMPKPELFGKNKILVLGEYGGLGLPLEGHTWQPKDNWGYQSFKNKEELFSKYADFVDRISAMIPLGLSAAIYTQTTDVEIETNGLMTYDRKVIKMPVAALQELHRKLYNSALVKLEEE